MKTINKWKALLMSAAMLVSGAMVSCEKEKGGQNLDAEIEVTASKTVVDKGDEITLAVQSNTTWTVSVTKGDDYVASYDPKGGNKNGIVTVKIADKEAAPGTAIEFLFEAKGYFMGYEFPEAETVRITIGEKEEEAPHAGTADDPYSVADAIAVVNALGADVESDDMVYVKGIVKDSDKFESFTQTGTFGNATFHIKDADADNEFLLYRIYYFDNKKYSSGPDIKEGDEVVVYGKIINFKGNTPETVQGTAYLYSLNGATDGGDDNGDDNQGGDILDSATVTLPYTLDTTGTLQTSNNAYADNADITVNQITWNFEGNGKMNPWRLGGKNLDGVNRTVYTKTAMNADVKAIELTHGKTTVDKVNTLTLIVAKDNAFTDAVSTLDIEFAASTTTTIEKPADADWNGCYYKFIYNVTASGDSNKYVEFSKVVFTDGNGGNGGDDTPNTPGDDTQHAGTAEDPFSIANAIAKAKEAGETTTTEIYYVKGKISNITYPFDVEHGTATFDMTDDSSKDSFTAYAVKYLNNESWVEGNDNVAVGDEVIVCGQLVNYGGNTPEIASKTGYIYKWLSKAENSETPGGGDEVEVPEGSFTLVTSLADFTSGQYVIVAEAQLTYLMPSSSASGKINGKTITISDNAIPSKDLTATDIWTVEKVTNGYKFKAANGYLGWSKSTDFAIASDSVSDVWTSVTFNDDGTFTIIYDTTQSTKRAILFQDGEKNHRFAPYAESNIGTTDNNGTYYTVKLYKN